MVPNASPAFAATSPPAANKASTSGTPASKWQSEPPSYRLFQNQVKRPEQIRFFQCIPQVGCSSYWLFQTFAFPLILHMIDRTVITGNCGLGYNGGNHSIGRCVRAGDCCGKSLCDLGFIAHPFLGLAGYCSFGAPLGIGIVRIAHSPIVGLCEL